MARRDRRVETEEQEDLNLAPIMNMVIILIPLLLLSVVFLKVGVIDVSTPLLTTGENSEPAPEVPEQKLTVTISTSGFQIATRTGVVPASGSCPATGPSVCLRASAPDLGASFRQASRHLEAGEHREGHEVLEAAVSGYDWRALYNELSRLKRENPEVRELHIAADPNIPYAAIVRLFDVARTRLEHDEYADAQAFWSASRRPGDATSAALFDQPILAIVQ